MGASRRGHSAMASLSFLLLVSSFLPAVRGQSTTFTRSVNGTEFTTFSFPKFDRALLQLPDNLTFSGNTTVTQNALQITPDSGNNNPRAYLVNQAGRVMFASPFVLWTSSDGASTNSSAADGRRAASFSTVFKCNLYRDDPESKGEGLAFVVWSTGDREPPPGSDGQYLGLTNATTDGSAANGFVAVELDSVKQPYDPDDNHVGLDVNGVRSVYANSLTPFGIQLAPLRNDTTNKGDYVVWIDYDGAARYVRVYMGTDQDTKPAATVLNASLDLPTILLGKTAYFGFSASTGVEYQLNCVLMWNITVENLADGATDMALSGWKLWLVVGCAAMALLLLLTLLLALFFFMKKKRGKKIGDEPGSLFRNAVSLKSMPGVPREFDYKELRNGTNNFDETTKLGQGGYGVVYRATVLGEHGQSTEVAVKQFSGANTKGQEDFLAELSIINLLRHRNLVKLVGWCHQNGVLLLVYDFMPNGSLDKHLFGGGPESPTSLGWEQRYNVVADVASAMNYLHHEYDQMVIHRDIKPSNIMLDSSFHARLGDFGLARALDSDKTSYTGDKAGVPGTLGYVAPECFHTGRATMESDVFGFGAVILEVVCGRRITCSNPAGCSQLLEGVWKLHGGGRILEAVDQRLAGEFNEGDAERLLLLGLACSHPNPRERPTTRAIVQILARSAPPPEVPPSKPAFMWPVHAADDVDGDACSTATSTSLTSSSAYYASSGWTQTYQVSREHDVAERDVTTM